MPATIWTESTEGEEIPMDEPMAYGAVYICRDPE
jgi:hypothetical protein